MHNAHMHTSPPYVMEKKTGEKKMKSTVSPTWHCWFGLDNSPVCKTTNMNKHLQCYRVYQYKTMHSQREYRLKKGFNPQFDQAIKPRLPQKEINEYHAHTGEPSHVDRVIQIKLRPTH